MENVVKMERKWSKNRAKIEQKWSKNGAKIKKKKIRMNCAPISTVTPPYPRQSSLYQSAEPRNQAHTPSQPSP